MKNTLKTFILLAGLTALLMAIGNAVGGRNGLMIALVFAGLMNFVGYWFSDKIALAMSGAQPVSESEAPDLYRMVRELCRRAELPMPRLYVIPSATPNAFATGRNPQHSAVAVTSGIMNILNRDELEGVVAHELAHIKNRDILISSVAAMIAGAISQLAHMAQWAMMFGGMGRDRDDEEGGGSLLGGLAMMIVGPIAAMLIQMAISRSREYQADATGAQICGRPLSLANALLKLESGNHRFPMHVNPAQAQMYIVNPLTAGGIAQLFSTHPPMAERVKRLQELAYHRS
ncbi:MAG: zinc metalloprotease HtpX [Acidobacteria bacterium]|nr:zinc metalloprotease HtpX [Acidobacteriota bacterium]MCI0620204.1 zinc metalloprotease HtpX [Acidobacteriota bacterium]MCI0720286.1 zinc metalloprotease HtpX [Acidobacteriota bacterium]